ncbi:hypothetical protein GQX74_009722 [Glossina fuscipes]|nr:hypothetical protein GQX74_009722 [Glossina fuscipes]
MNNGANTMPVYVDMTLNAIHDYFAQLNPIATRIAYDINETKSSYEYIWDTLDCNEQDDIVNDTLIRPEISLRYLNDFFKPADLNSLTKIPQSTKSLAAVMLESFNKCDAEGKIPAFAIEKYPNEAHELKEEAKYGYDGRNLRTFALQEVALKFVHDDNLCVFYDEHSHPFSYRTKSQINLQLTDDCSEYCKRPKVANNINTKCLCCNVASVHRSLCNVKAHKFAPISCVNSNKNDLKNPPTKSKPNSCIFPYDSECIDKINFDNLDFKVEWNNRVSRPKSSSGQTYLSSTSKTALTPSVNYMVCSDDLYDKEDNLNLMHHNCKVLDFLQSLPATISGDDELTPSGHNTDKSSDGASKLLNRDTIMQKGFEFLNNW